MVRAFDWRRALVTAVTIATPFLFIWACAAAYEQRGYLAMGGELGVLLLPAIVAGFVYVGEE